MSISSMAIPPELAGKIVKCIEDAVGDSIRADIRESDLRTYNSVPSRIWDYINRNIIRALEAMDCSVITAHRGPWEMLVIFEKSTQNVITFMREKRFSELQRQQHRRNRMHYVDMLAKQFNSDLLADQDQLSIFPHEFSDEDRLAELVQTLLYDLDGNAEIVRHHILVLFDTVGFQLAHIRAVMVTPTLEIAQGSEWDWSRYISVVESAVVETVDDTHTPAIQPNRGLTLKARALERKRNKPKPKANNLDMEKGG